MHGRQGIEEGIVIKPRFTMVVLLVEDLPRSLAFYRRLGIEFAPGADERRDVGVDIGDGRTIIWSTTFGANDPERRAPSGGSRIMLEFFVESDAEVDEKFAELAGAGYHVVREPFRTSFGAYMCLIDDPDGNTVLVTAG
jgi:catechol 2,3-dioxygenase-like lactoylglutathione lyase family enzyme